jgi:hypothetical protein
MSWETWHEQHPEVRKSLKRLNRERRRQLKQAYVLDYLKHHPCIDCGEADPIVLDFDHVSGRKRSRVSALIVSWCSLKILVDEIEKCAVRCANCHRKRHARDQGWYKNIGELQLYLPWTKHQ